MDSVLIEGQRAVGVKLVDGEILSAAEVILAAGTFGSPAILLRSGIGPSQHLTKLGIATIANLPVGDRLQDQPFFYVPTRHRGPPGVLHRSSPASHNPGR